VNAPPAPDLTPAQQPRTPLSPHTEYKLIATLRSDRAGEQQRSVVTFKTGSQRSPTPAPPKGAFLQHFQYSGRATGDGIGLLTAGLMAAAMFRRCGRRHPTTV
jgi:hypothetical protein